MSQQRLLSPGRAKTGLPS
jgi:hypothetical protein